MTVSLKDHTVKYAKSKKEEAEKSLNKKRSVEMKLHDDVAMVRGKEQHQWKLKDYNILSSYKKQTGDSPLKKKLQEAKVQYENRKDRSSPAKPSGWRSSIGLFELATMAVGAAPAGAVGPAAAAAAAASPEVNLEPLSTPSAPWESSPVNMPVGNI